MNKFKQTAKEIRMTAAEKSTMRAQLFGLPSPLAPSKVEGYYSFFTISAFLQMRTVVAALLIVVLVGSGTAYAAEGALPGEPLYAVKININESMRVALAPTPAGKAQVHAQLAERRVKEAEALAATGRLDTGTSESLAANFESHVANADEFALEIAHEDPVAATELKVKLSASLEAHGTILATLGAEGPRGPSQDNSGTLAAKVIARAQTPTMAYANTRAKAEPVSFMAPAPAGRAMPAGTVSPAAEAAATQPSAVQAEKTATILQEKVQTSLKEARTQYQDNKKAFDDSTVAKLEKQFALAEEHQAQGSAALQAGAYAQAREHFTETLQITARLSALLEAQKKYDRNIIRTLLNVNVHFDDDR